MYQKPFNHSPPPADNTASPQGLVGALSGIMLFSSGQSLHRSYRIGLKSKKCSEKIKWKSEHIHFSEN